MIVIGDIDIKYTTEVVNNFKSENQVTEHTYVLHLNNNVMEDGLYHSNTVRLRFEYQFMSKDQRRLGKSLIHNIDFYYCVYLIPVRTNYNKHVEGLVHWDDCNKKEGFETIP